MTSDFIKLLELLAENKIEFVVVGGLAAVAYGSSMVTQDLDICVNLSHNNLDKLSIALSKLHPIHRIGNKKIPFDQKNKDLYFFKNIYLDTDYGQLDCLGEIKGIGNFDEVLNKSIELTIENNSYHFLSLPALIKSKEALGRPKDKEAVLILNVILEKNTNK